MSTKAQLNTAISTLGSGDKNTAQELRAVLALFADSLFLTGDVKEVDCDSTHIALNFDNTGLGINERVGWAICNGLNGTKDRNGRTSIAYGSDYTTIGATAGSKDAVVVAHSHGGIPRYAAAIAGANGGGRLVTDGLGTTDSAGVSGENKNMQPYIVSLFIQKL